MDKMYGGPRNFGAVPILDREGTFRKPLDVPARLLDNPYWKSALPVHDRLNYHHTLSSVRRYVHFEPLPGIVPLDSLDLYLEAQYDHGKDIFPEPVDVVLQNSTTLSDTRRRLRNTIDLSEADDAIGAAIGRVTGHHFLRNGRHQNGVFISGLDTGGHISPMMKWTYDHKLYGRYNQGHPLYVNGLKYRRHPSNIKLMNSSHHSPQTNAGYSRQDSDGNAYQY